MLSNIKRIKRIAVTGTKGKTIVAHMLSWVLRSEDSQVLRVDSTGCYFGDSLVSGYDESIRAFGRSPNVFPGRYIYNAIKSCFNFEVEGSMYAVLEAGIGSNTYGGVGTKHSIGILTNVYDDHIDYKSIKSRDDILSRKSFIFRDLPTNGVFITSLDSPQTVKALEGFDGVKIGFTAKPSPVFMARIKKEKYKLDDLLYPSEHKLFSVKHGELFDLSRYKYYFGGKNSFAAENVAYVFAAAMQFLSIEKISERLSHYLLPISYGRWQIYSKGEQNVMVDYAHEAVSLKGSVSMFAGMHNKKPVVVTRIAPDRSDAYIQQYAREITSIEQLDSIIVFDKIQEGKSYRGRNITRNSGEILSLIKDLDNTPKPITFLNSELEALANAVESGKNVIHIYSNLDLVYNFLLSKGFEKVV